MRAVGLPLFRRTEDGDILQVLRLVVQAESVAGDVTFTVSDGKHAIAVRHKGTPPDLFGEGRGAVVEGSWAAEGYFKSSHIMAKHSEEYTAPHDPSAAGYKELLRTLQGAPRWSGDGSS